MRGITASLLSIWTCLVLFQHVVYAADEASKTAETAAQTTGDPNAERLCEASIFYTWKRGTVAKKNNTGGQASAESTESTAPFEVFFTRIGEQAKIEADAKSRLAARLKGAEADALHHCAQLHQNQAACVASHLKSTAKNYRELDFASRKALLNAISSDCRENTGECMSAGSSSIACYENRSPDVVLTVPDAQQSNATAKDKK